MEFSEADYVMFCDQDDIWLPDKIDKLMTAMHRLEEECGTDIPLLVHSDLTVVGQDLERISESFWAHQGADPSSSRSVNRLLIQNVVTGCASLCNRKLIEMSLPVPAEAMMHDWWLALVAASFGRIGSIPDTTVLYRQHGKNTLGAKQLGFFATLMRGIRSPIGAYSRARRVITATERQAQAYLEAYDASLSAPVRHIIRRFADLPKQGFIQRRVTVIRHRFLAGGIFLRLVILAAI